ncbi:hypothetical protein F4801DRAFT_567319 [Xylaria longipes]|nr:hypothetical protein F4801DRAFT_567319 [Xylaria longipes]RYC62469.1 hypothetical protein CHU98_g3760 [Xylaria longipes]
MAPVPMKPTKDPATASMPESATPYTRLHITPFDQSLQNVVIPASVLPRARNISYHTLETFPEKRFGFVDLPTMEADKLKKKLNGAVLRGSKVRVEIARPESIPDLPADTDNGETKKDNKKKKSKKRKREADIIEGVRLEGRKIKRGWTTTEQEMIEEKRGKANKEKKDGKPPRDEEKKDKKDRKKRATVKSKYTDEPECLFKTKLPNTNPSKETEETEEGTSTPKKKRKRKSGREVVVHEFEKTTKYPTFLKSSPTGTSAEATTFEDGVGWVDSTGKVVEPVKSRRRPEGIPAPAPRKPQKVVPTPQEEDDDDETSSSGSSSSSDDDDTSNSGSESDSSDKQETILNAPKELKVNTPALSSPSALAKPESARPKSSGSITSLSIKIPPTTPAVKKVHPLEALYKRLQGGESTPKAGSEAKPFSFFGNEDDIEEDGDSMAPTSQAPMTPFTKQEFEFRNIRSAAPTPDTAHPSRTFNFWASQGSTNDARPDEEDDDEGLEGVEEEEAQEQDEDVDMAGRVTGEQTSQTPASDFQKQFWESRGDLNRAWRKRRKSAAKEKRYRDNRARAERAI